MSSVSTKAGAALAAEVARRRKVVEIPSTDPAPSSANVHVVTADATSHEPSLDERTRIFARGLKLPVPNRPDQHIDLAFLDPLVFLREPFTAALSDYLQDRPASTREGFVGSVRTGICAFLVGAKPDASMSTLSSDLIRAYIDWQHSPLASETGQAVLQPGTNASRTKAARFLFGVLRKSTRWGADAAAIHSFFPTNLGKGVSGTATPRQTLTQDLLNEIYAAAKREIDTLGSRFKEGDDLLRQGDELVEAGKDTPELPVIYSRMVSAYPNAFPVRETICSDRQLRRDLQHLQYLGYGGIVTLARYRYASAIDLVPIGMLASKHETNAARVRIIFRSTRPEVSKAASAGLLW